MAARKPLFLSSEGFSEEMAEADSMTLGALTMGGNIAMGGSKVTGAGAATADGDLLAYGQAGADLNGLTSDANIVLSGGAELSGLPSVPTGDTYATSKLYVDSLVASGIRVKEAVLVNEQLNDAEGILASSAITMQSNPVEDDYIEITDGTTTRQYEFGTGLTTGDVLVAIGATVADTMANLAAAIVADGSAIWGAEFNTEHPDIDSDGSVVIIEDDNDGTASKVWGVWATPANVQVVDFGGEDDYTKTALTNLPGSLPGATNFGFNRTQSAVDDGDLHYCLGDDVLYAWDNDATTWNTMSGGGSIPDATAASGGGVKGKLSGDSDKGVDIQSGVLEVTLASNVGLEFSGGAVSIKIDDTPDTLDADADGLKVVGVPSLFKINGTAVGATVDAAALDTLTDGSNADGEHVHDYSASGHTHAHSATTGQTADDHHAQAHSVASHNDTTATGAELETLTDGSNADLLHVHDGGAHSHDHADLNNVTADQHHAQSHTVASHSDTTGTGAQLNTLTAGASSDADALHTHDGLSDSAHVHTHASTTGQGANDHHNESHTVASHSDTSATGAELDTLTDTSNADSLHTHDFAASGHTHAHSATTGQTANDHHNQSHVLDGGDHSVTGLTTGDVLTATSATTFAFQAPDADEADRVEKDINVSEAVAKADPLYISGASTVGKADAGVVAKARVTGVARTAQGTVGQPVPMVAQGTSAGAWSGTGVSGSAYYLQDTGGIATTLPGAGKRVIRIGYALNTNDLWVAINDYGKKAA